MEGGLVWEESIFLWWARADRNCVYGEGSEVVVPVV